MTGTTAAFVSGPRTRSSLTPPSLCDRPNHAGASIRTMPNWQPSTTQLHVSTPEELRLNPKKEPLVTSYGIAHKLYTALAVLIFLMPDRTSTARLASKWGGAAGYYLAGRAFRILQGAARAGRLASDTYKRLNVGLIGFCLTFWAMPAEAGFLLEPASTRILTFVLSASKAFGLVLAVTGWQYGVDKEGEQFFKPGELVQDFFRGCRDTLKGMRVKNAKKALAYRNLLVFVLIGLMSSLFEGIFDVRYQEAFKRSAFDISIQWSAISRLFLISTMIYSLKDAAERDRLTGSTFIQMNILVGSWALAVGFAQGLLGYWIEMLAFALPFYIKAYKSRLEKNQKKGTEA